MRTELREVAGELAGLLWREHTVYRDRSGHVVIRGEHVQRWISLAPAGGRGEVALRAGRILEGGTTAPARAEAVVPLSAGTVALAAACRRLLAETAEAAATPVRRTPVGRRDRGSGRTARPRRGRSGRRMSPTSWVVLACVAGFLGLCFYSVWPSGS
ncbi:hypothetical protein [Streptomyces sp. NPDC053079]|uniref:hypothetical protein n=1 Tax=Streptomyces sp. NPDC053079 TaxID=3365697 RepID=UPI0037D44D7B